MNVCCCYKAELLNTTREEQIVKKQQILEELQKVEAELHEKARAQLMLNVEQKQRSQQQQLLQQQVCSRPRKYWEIRNSRRWIYWNFVLENTVCFRFGAVYAPFLY